MIGRTREVSELIELYNHEKAELVAVYGRRRVGKTYLVDETFRGRITFRHAGLSQIEMSENPNERPIKKQLRAFYYSLLTQGMEKDHCPVDWLEAFFMLEMFLQKKDDGSRQIIFLDELPWMDTPKSGFITAFEGFWNSWACYRNVMVIVSGSATSWIQDKLIGNHGGLYGRVTYEIKLESFTLYECEALFKENGVKLSRYDVVQSYMIFGGIPYYLNYFQRGRSLAQNVDDLFFNKGAKLALEFDRLFSSVFTNADMIKQIVKALSTTSIGLTRGEIVEKTDFSGGGNLTESLRALIASDFIIQYVPFSYSKREVHYKLIDPFCIFYLKFIENRESMQEDFWKLNVTSQKISSWRGYAFENVCFNHIKNIKAALGISGINTTESSWVNKEKDGEGAQVDLLITRADNVINMCEIKYYGKEFCVDKKYDMVLRNRQAILSEKIPRKYTIHNILITTYGIKDNEYKWSFDNVITMDDLFKC